MFALSYLVILIVAGAVSIAGVGMTQQPATFHATIEVVSHKDLGYLNMVDEKPVQKIDVTAPAKISELVNYSSYEVLSCHFDNCNGGLDGAYEIKNNDHIKVVISG